MTAVSQDPDLGLDCLLSIALGRLLDLSGPRFTHIIPLIPG